MSKKITSMIERGELTIFDGVYTDREIHRMNEWFGTYQHWGLGYDMVEYGAASATLCKSLKWDMWSGMHIMLDDMQNLMRERLDSYIDVPYFHRCLMNNFKFGDSPMFHKDAKAEEAMTFIIYPNYKWELNWGGYTAFADDDDNVIAAINPKPGRVIAFPSRINHSGVSPTKVHEGFGRFSVAFQDPNGTSDPSTRTPSMPKDILENTGTITGLRLIDE